MVRGSFVHLSKSSKILWTLLSAKFSFAFYVFINSFISYILGGIYSIFLLSLDRRFKRPSSRISLFTSTALIFLDKICSERVFLLKNRKSNSCYCISCISNKLDTNFQPKLTILGFFCPNYQEGYSCLNKKKWTSSLNCPYLN